ncbi:MAG: aspartyl protease family protein [Blastocatellia bacterium]|nr:aspartyl protease family protein [Blastocatellia bacterium]
MTTWHRVGYFLGFMSLFCGQAWGGKPEGAEIIRFRIEQGQLIVIPVKINGMGPFSFVLDTGTTLTMVSHEVARTTGIQTHETVQVATVAGVKTRGRGQVENLEIGQRSFSGSDVIVTVKGELTGWSASVDGILGQNILNRMNFLLDYQSKQVQFWNLETGYQPTSGVKLESHLQQGRIVVELTQSKTKTPLRLMVDSGSSGLLFFEPAATDLELDVVRSNQFLQVRTPTGGNSVWQGELRRLKVGEKFFSNLPVTFVRRSLPGGREHGLLPTSLFSSVYVNNQDKFVVFNPKD